MFRRFGLFAVLGLAALALAMPSQAQEGDSAVLAMGIRQTSLAIDGAGVCAVWGSWPNP